MLAGEEAQFMMQSRDSQAVPVTLNLTCPNGGAVFKMLTSAQPQAATIPAEISGPCTAKLASEGNQYYQDSLNDYLVINSPIIITEPSDQKSFNAGETISISEKAADGANPVVTAVLVCQGVESGSVTGLLGSELVLEPVITAYGACTLQLSAEEAYFDVSKATVGVSIYLQLSIVAPLEGSSIVGGEEYEFMVSSIDKAVDASVLVRGVCSYGEFTAQVLSNTPLTLSMNSTIQGDCKLTAEIANPYYLLPSDPVSIIVMSKVSILWSSLRSR